MANKTDQKHLVDLGDILLLLDDENLESWDAIVWWSIVKYFENDYDRIYLTKEKLNEITYETKKTIDHYYFSNKFIAEEIGVGIPESYVSDSIARLENYEYLTLCDDCSKVINIGFQKIAEHYCEQEEK
jgi:hypothetical protein